jgi:hypothetical protein
VRTRFRGPSLDNGRVPILSVPLNALFEAAPGQGKLHLLRVGDRRGVRDLAPHDNGILILAGPNAAEEGPYDIYWWDAVSENVRHLADITKTMDADRDRKPEAILPLDEGHSGLRVLVLSDGAEEGEPRVIRIPSP